MELHRKNPVHELVQNYCTYQCIYLPLCSLDEWRIAAGLEAAGAAAILHPADGFMVSRCHLLAQSSPSSSSLPKQMLQLFADAGTPIHPFWVISWALQSKCSLQPSTCKTALLAVPPGVLFSWEPPGLSTAPFLLLHGSSPASKGNCRRSFLRNLTG